MKPSKKLEDLVDRILIDAANKTSPGLRTTIRAALNKGATPKEIRRRHGMKRGKFNLTACCVDAIVSEWERENT